MPKISRALPRGGPTPIAKVSEKNDPKPLSQVEKKPEILDFFQLRIRILCLLELELEVRDLHIFLRRLRRQSFLTLILNLS